MKFKQPTIIQNINLERIKDVTFISSSRVIIILSQFVYIKLYTKYLTNYELGIYFFLMTVSYSLNAVLFVPVDYYQQSKIYTSIENNISLKTYIIFNKKLIFYIVSVVILILIPFLFINRLIALYILVSFLVSIFSYMTGALRGLLNNLEHRRVVVFNMSIEALSKVLFFYIAVHFMIPNSLTLFVSNIGALVFCLLLLGCNTWSLHIFREGLIKEVKLKEIFIFSYPLSIGAVINWIQVQGYRMILVPLGLVEMVGIFATVSNIGTAGMSAYSSVFTQLYIPNIYKTHGRYVSIFIRNAVLSVAVIILTSYLLSDIIVNIATKTEFVKYSNVILYGIITESSNLILGALGIYFAIKNKTMIGLKVSFFGLMSLMTVFAVIFLFKYINIYTIGLPIVLSQILSVLIFLLFYKRELKNA
jgi:O-antigen/teichoic acid export membrane protein